MKRIEGYLLIPHELLHVIGYKLVGKRCFYRWGNRYVTTLDPMTRDEELVGLLFPFVVCMVVWLILLPVPVVALFFEGWTWAVGLSVFLSIPFIYAFTSIGDLRRAYRLIFNKPQDNPTPFDFLFWPVMAEHRKALRISSLVILIGLAFITGLYYFLVLP